MTVRYRDLAGASYEDVWTINPLLYEGVRQDEADNEKGLEPQRTPARSRWSTCPYSPEGPGLAAFFSSWTRLSRAERPSSLSSSLVLGVSLASSAPPLTLSIIPRPSSRCWLFGTRPSFLLARPSMTLRPV